MSTIVDTFCFIMVLIVIIWSKVIDNKSRDAERGRLTVSKLRLFTEELLSDPKFIELYERYESSYNKLAEELAAANIDIRHEVDLVESLEEINNFLNYL